MAFDSIYVPDFSIQAVVRAEPVPCRRAIALVEGCPPLERVVAINEAAARAGLDLGMTKSQAAQFRSIAIRPRSRAQEQAAHAALLDLGWSISPRIEDTAGDSIVVDLAGLASLFGSEETISHLLARRASDLGLIVHVAVSSNLEVALHAARGFPGITVIPPGEESKRLGELADRGAFSFHRGYRNSRALGCAHMRRLGKTSSPRALRTARPAWRSAPSLGSRRKPAFPDCSRAESLF